MIDKVTVFWFRRDLRLNDNSGLYYALQTGENVLPLFIFDEEILKSLSDKSDRRLTFIADQLKNLKSILEQHGSSLLVKYGKPLEVFKLLAREYSLNEIYTNHDYEPYARQRDENVGKWLKSQNIGFKTFKDQVIFERDEVLKDDRNPYTVYTPYMKRWKALLSNTILQSFASEKLLDRCVKMPPQPDIDLKKASFTYLKSDYPASVVDVEIIRNYDKTRDIPSIEGTSKLSVHLRFGTISIRELVRIALENNPVFLNELIWREFYMMILWHYPQVVTGSFRPQYDNVQWINDEKQFIAWCEGRTGFPIVDAGMRQLNATGYMHNRVRMITASFLTKHLLIDWRWGEAYFAEKLLDFELSSNNGGWQWAAGSGCDAAPYFRVFNPELQTRKFDPELKYIKKWLPEFGKSAYPEPIVDHRFARERVLTAYKKALASMK